ncbi:MAG: Stf0 family sulfotransferase [Gaiellaceae bacterium]
MSDGTSPKPRSSVVICALPRSGSSLLGALLHSSGIVSRPAEWFWRDDRERLSREWRVRRFEDYLPRVLEAGTSPNGVFAMKLMWGYFHELLFELRRLAREYDADDLAVLRSFFPEPRFVWIRRMDVVAQAVSWAKAAQTEQWAAHQPSQREPEFDFEQIDALYNLSRVHDGYWCRWFAAHGIEPFSVVYEQLAAEPEDAVHEVLAFLGLEAEAPLSIPANLTRQADAVNGEWIARYRELAGL